MSDVVNHPPHYKVGGIEAIDVIEAYSLGFCLGNVLKYILRSGRKSIVHGTTVVKSAEAIRIEDLKKARWYLDREIATLESAETEYKPRDDLNKSVEASYDHIRNRVANGGPGWDPHKKATT